MFLILTTALVVCAHAGLTCGYRANSSDVHLVDATLYGHPMEFSNKTIALQSLTRIADLSQTEIQDAIASLFTGVHVRDVNTKEVCQDYSPGLIDLFKTVAGRKKLHKGNLLIPAPTTAFLELADVQPYEVYVSTRTDKSRKIPSNHAEELIGSEYHTMDEFQTKVSRIYVTKTPCVKCTEILMKYYSDESHDDYAIHMDYTEPDIYVPWVYRVGSIDGDKIEKFAESTRPDNYAYYTAHDTEDKNVAQINAVMRFLRRGIKVKPLLLQDTKKLLEKVCKAANNYKAELGDVCKDAVKVVNSNTIFQHRHSFTNDVLKTISIAVQRELKLYGKKKNKLLKKDYIPATFHSFLHSTDSHGIELNGIRGEMLMKIIDLHKKYSAKEVCKSKGKKKKKEKKKWPSEAAAEWL